MMEAKKLPNSCTQVMPAAQTWLGYTSCLRLLRLANVRWTTFLTMTLLDVTADPASQRRTAEVAAAFDP